MAERLNAVRHARWRIRFTKAIVITEDGKTFKVKLDTVIRSELHQARRTAKALDHL
jgi:hypothetical protein